LAGSCDHGNEPSDSMKCGVLFFDHLNEFHPKNMSHGIG